MEKVFFRRGFTILEVVFVIVVIGILAAIAIPRFAMTRNDAIITRAKTTVAAIRSAISTERQKRILRGEVNDDIDGSDVEALLNAGLSNNWNRNGDTFTFTAPDGSTCTFKVQNNKFVKQASCAVSEMSDL